MLRPKTNLVSALLPLLPLAFCQGCGGGSSSSDTAPQSSAQPPVSAPVTVNQAPTISGQVVVTARVGEIYEWQPVAADAEGDSLSFTATNLPPWASIGPTDGRIVGTPGPDDVGIYESITITVADAAHQSVTQPFSITVMGDIGSGVASLQWEIPPSKVDGSPLDDLAGYRILYGRNSGDLDNSVLVDDPAMTSYEFSTLSSGTWYFAVVAVSSSGLEGPPTTTASKSI
jgi:hypothetical protein